MQPTQVSGKPEGRKVSMKDKVQRHQIYEVVMDHIKAEIASGRLQPGDRIETVRELAQNLGVGQSSVREAVRVLSYMGLLRVKHGGGIFVTEQLEQNKMSPATSVLPEGTRTSMRQLLELRLAIEPMVARLAAEHATEDEVREIVQRYEFVQHVHETDLKAFQEESALQEEDVLFHMAIANASHNPLLLDALERVHGQLRESRRITSRVPQLVDSALRFHPQIAESIAAHNAVRAENFMRTHIEDVVWWLEAYDAKHRISLGDDTLSIDTSLSDISRLSSKKLLATEFTLDPFPR